MNNGRIRQCRPPTAGTYIIKTRNKAVLFKNGPQCKNYIGGGGAGEHGGLSMIRLNPLCFPSYPLTHIKVHIRCKNNQNFSSFNLRYKNNEINKHQNFIFGTQCKNVNLWLFGRPWWPFNNQICPILLPSYPLTCSNLHVKY